MSELSFGPLLHNKNGIKSKERKVNFINVNNYFNPQINIIKVNKLNETKKNNKEKKKVNENDYKNNFNIRKRADDNNYIKKLKIIQLWWKDINKIIKIQKNFRGFIFRNKLLEILEKEEKLTSSLFVFYIIIRKIIISHIIKKIKQYILYLKNEKNNNYTKYNFINRKLIKKTKENNLNKNYKLNNEKYNDKNVLSNNTNNSKKKINYEINVYKYFIKKRKDNNLKNNENATFNSSNINKVSKKKFNNEKKIDDELFTKIKQLIKKKYLISKRKSFFNNNLNNIKGFNNIGNIESINFNKIKKEKNILNSENNNNIRKIKKKILVKSRNIESNKTNFSSNNLKHINKNILTTNNQYIFSTNKNINEISNNKTKNNVIKTDRAKLPKNFNMMNNLIINNTIHEYNNKNKNKNISKRRILINKNKLICFDFKERNDIIKYYFSLWKEKIERKIIIEYLIKKGIYINFEKSKIIIINRNHKKPNTNYIFHKFKEIINRKALGLLIKKILNKCTLYKYFILFNHYTDKIKIFQKLKMYMNCKFKFNSKIYNKSKYLGIKLENKENKENKYIPITIPRRIKYKKKKIKKEKLNKLSLSSSFISQNKKKLSININKEINNLNNSNEYFPLHQKVKINKSIYNNLFKKEKNNNKNKNKRFKSIRPNLFSNSNLIMQINQLKMIFNLIELHKKRNKSLANYFNRWKKLIKSNNNTNTINININMNKIKNKYNNFQFDHNNKLNSRNLSSRERLISDDYSPLKQKIRNKSCKNKEIYSKIKYKINNHNHNINIRINNNNSINMIYKKKFFNIGSRTSRNNVNIDYLNMFEFKNILNNDDIKKNSYNNLNNYINSNNQTLSSFSFGDTFYKKKNTIEEKEIFFNRTVKTNNQYNITSYKNNKNGFSINYYYKNIPKKRNTFYGSFYLNKNKNKNSINRYNDKIDLKYNHKKKNRTYDNNKKGYYYDFFIRLLVPRKKTL